VSTSTWPPSPTSSLGCEPSRDVIPAMS
jgi:hypothetical protein